MGLTADSQPVALGRRSGDGEEGQYAALHVLRTPVAAALEALGYGHSEASAAEDAGLESDEITAVVPGPALASVADALADTAHDLRVVVELEGPTFPAPSHDSVARLASSGVAEIRVQERVVVGESAQDSMDWLRFLRDATEHGVSVRWDGAVVGIPIDLIDHLPPPAPDPDSRSAFRYACFFWRQGPDYIKVSDVREGRELRATIYDPDLLVPFLALRDPCRDADLEAGQRSDVRALAEEGLVLAFDGWYLTLPHRLRRWPVPCLAI